MILMITSVCKNLSQIKKGHRNGGYDSHNGGDVGRGVIPPTGFYTEVGVPWDFPSPASVSPPQKCWELYPNHRYMFVLWRLQVAKSVEVGVVKRFPPLTQKSCMKPCPIPAPPILFLFGTNFYTHLFWWAFTRVDPLPNVWSAGKGYIYPG